MALLLSGMALCNGTAQSFSSGSDGSYGPLNITSNTSLEMPESGIFNCTTISVAQGFTLTFKRNPLNTPIYLLATGNVLINGVIDVGGNNSNPNIPDGGLGGPGGFDGGKPAYGSVPPGTGLGPGGGKGGSDSRDKADHAGGGAFGSVPASFLNANCGKTYSSPLLIPMIGGSGGGGTIGQPGRGGGGGGGAILIASSTRIDVSGTGKILARGGGARDTDGYSFNPGSGGAIRLVSPEVAGTGEVNAKGGNYDYAGHGRIRVDSIKRTALQFNFQPTSVTSVGSTMLVFPTPLPRLDVIEAAGKVIQPGSGPVFVQLPYNAPTNQTVVVQAKDFDAVVPIRVVLTPDNGDQLFYDAAIDNHAANPASATVNVVMPVNVQVTIHVWTR